MKLQSPLNEDGYKSIEQYFNAHKDELTKANINMYEGIESFRQHFTDFELSLSELTETEKLRAWFQLYSKTKQHIRSQNEILEQTEQKKINRIPIKKKKKITFIHVLGIMMAATVGVGIGLWSNQTKNDNVNMSHVEFVNEVNEQSLSESRLKSMLKDPNSAAISSQHGYCGLVNSKNSLGGYSGYKRYVASPSIVVIEGEDISTDEFQQIWDANCR